MQVLIIFSTILALGNALPRLHGQWHNANTLIVGGREAEQGEVPYQLGIRYYNQHHCGASIIEVQGLTLAVSAAHCYPDFVPPDALTVVAGDVSLSDSTGHEQTRRVTKIVNHENFNSYTYENDIALLFIDEPFDFNENVQPIALPDAGTITTGELSVSGWGKLEHDGSAPDVMQIVEVPVVDGDACQNAYDELGDTIFESFICGGYLGIGGKDACQGDSGGPARSVEGNYLAGVVSWGEGCADPRYPGIYTEVAYFVEWINEMVSQHRPQIAKTN